VPRSALAPSERSSRIRRPATTCVSGHPGEHGPDNSFIASPSPRPGIVRVEARLRDFSFPLHSHDHVCIGLMHAGEYTSRYGLLRYRPYPGDVILVAPGEVHDGRPAGYAGRAYTMLEIEGAAFAGLCAETLGTAWLEFPRAVVRDARVTRALAEWLRSWETPDVHVEREAAAMLLGLLATLDRPQHLAPRMQRDLALRVRRLLGDRHWVEDSVGELAAELGASRYQLIRACKEVFGVTPEDYRRQLRVQRARALLRGPFALAVVAAEAGFADQSHMTREFRRLTGLTPGSYRRALQWRPHRARVARAFKTGMPAGRHAGRAFAGGPRIELSPVLARGRRTGVRRPLPSRASFRAAGDRSRAPRGHARAVRRGP